MERSKVLNNLIKKLPELDDLDLQEVENQIQGLARERKRMQELLVSSTCIHSWAYAGSGRHGSDKGHEYYKCQKAGCVAELEDGSTMREAFKRITIHHKTISYEATIV